MHFTDIFIKRPVLATVVSLIILFLGLRAGADLNVRQYPFLQNAQVSVTVAYPGADPTLIEGFITTPLEREVSQAGGIDFMTSSSVQGSSTITANLRQDKDPNEAMTEISAKVNKLRNQLPEGSEDPIIAIADSGGNASMYMDFSSDVLDPSQITDYLERVVQPQLAAIPGLEAAELYGARAFAMRIWLQTDRLAAHNLTASEVITQLRAQNVLSAVGETKGNFVRIGLAAQTDLRTVEEFRKLVVRSDGDSVTRLGDVAEVVLGSDTYDGSSMADAKPAIFMGIKVRPDANVLDVIGEVNRQWPGIVAALPVGLKGKINYDGSEYIRESISEVQKTLIEAVVIVVIVIFLFLGSMRNSLIPAVTVPLSLVGTLFLMLVLGFTINLLTLLAMVLAIGMVVDDAIIVMENVHRHIEEGMKPFDAAIKGARELVGPVIAMTITLVAVYAPIGFLSGITGTLFIEFAFTLAGAVLISGIIALTLTPMMCARLLKPSVGEDGKVNKLQQRIDKNFEWTQHQFKRLLHGALDYKLVIAIFGGIVFVSCGFLFMQTPTELAPAEDQGFFFSIAETDGFSSQEYLDHYFLEMQNLEQKIPEVQSLFAFTIGNGGSTNQGFLGTVLKPWSERTRSAEAVIADLTTQFGSVAGVRTAVINPPSLPTPGQGYPLEFVIKSTASTKTLAEIGDQIVARAMQSKQFFFVAPGLRLDRPEAVVTIDRDKAALMGVDMAQISADLSALLAGGEVNRFNYQSRSYRVIQQVQRESRLDPTQLEGYYTRSRDGQLVPISTLVTISNHTVARSINHFQQLNANTIIAVPRPGVTQGAALKVFEDAAAELLPDGSQVDYAGASRQFKQEGAALLGTFAFSMIIIYLVLAAQFESFRDPLIMLVTVPMSICGALLVLNIFALTNGMQLTHLPGMTLNIYTQVGLVTLIGVISKHGILIVEFANKLQEQGLSKRDAIEEATSIRLRPVLMTTAALVIAMVPLLTASGPGAASRFSMGLIIAAGMSIGTLFTLYIVPAAYLYIGRDYAKLATKTKPAVLKPAAQSF